MTNSLMQDKKSEQDQNYKKELFRHYTSQEQPSIQLPFNESELDKAMDEARQSFASWKQLQQTLEKAIRNVQNEQGDEKR